MGKKENCREESVGRCFDGGCGVFLHKIMMVVMVGVMAFLVWHGYRGAKRLVNGYLRNKEYLRLNLAVDGCNRAALRETVEADGVKVQEPIREVFTQCMEDKGYLEYRSMVEPLISGEEVME